ncbi:hypothetical protein J6590_065546, partial [Homalodisca vitripennis]
ILRKDTETGGNSIYPPPQVTTIANTPLLLCHLRNDLSPRSILRVRYCEWYREVLALPTQSARHAVLNPSTTLLS